MQHMARCGPLEVDHFDPRKKTLVFQDYANLFPASRSCNGKKSDWWPTEEEKRAGCRFLNPCEEMDYDEQILEHPISHELIGLNPAARWHIRMCGLNAPLLILERQKRASHWQTIKDSMFVMKKSNYAQLIEMVTKYNEEVALMVPLIKYLPKTSI